jgi:hypothetical protein
MPATTPTTLPRRANQIRALAAGMAHAKLTEVTARQAISDKSSYALAVLLGGVASWLLGWPGVALLVCWHALAAARAHRAWVKVKGLA